MNPLFDELSARLKEAPGKRLLLPGLELREAAVLVPFFVREGSPFILLTKRPETLRNHAGQISFPGGRRDLADATLLHTALRETHEEIGIPPDRVQVLGMLDELPVISGFRVTPFVGLVPPDLKYVPSPHEIEQIIEVPLKHLLHPAHQRTERLEREGASHDIYYFDFGPHVIWGATAKILRELFRLSDTLPSFQALAIP